MTQYTKKAILGNFETMLEEMPFDKITVSALVRRCEISSNTFYYHYRDIYDLLDAWLHEKFSLYAAPMSMCDGWRAAAKALLRDCADDPNMVYHVFNSISRDRLERFIFSLSSDVFFRLVSDAAADYAVPADKLHEIADLCRYSFGGLFLRFLWGRMKEDVDQMVDSYGELIEGFVEGAVRKYPRRI